MGQLSCCAIAVMTKPINNSDMIVHVYVTEVSFTCTGTTGQVYRLCIKQHFHVHVQDTFFPWTNIFLRKKKLIFELHVIVFMSNNSNMMKRHQTVSGQPNRKALEIHAR